MKRWKRLCAVLSGIAFLLSLSGCFALPVPLPTRQDAAPAREALSEDEKFDAFIDAQFAEEVQASYLSMHILFEHPENYGLDPSGAEVVFGETGEAEDEAYRNGLRERKKQFEQFDRSLLTGDRQDTYDIYQYALKVELGLADEAFQYYGSAFETGSGIHSAIPMILTSFVVRSEEDAANLVKLVENTKPYMRSMLEYTKRQAEEGTLMVAIDEVGAYCRKIADSGMDSAVLKTMEDNIDALGLPAQTAEGYKEGLRKAFADSFLPAYRETADTLDALKDYPNNTLGLAALPEGKRYYEYLFRQATGFSCSIEETKKLLERSMDEALVDMGNAMEENPEAARAWLDGEAGTGYTDFDSMVKDLEAFSTRNFPGIGAVDYEIRPAEEGVATDSVGAYYVIPAIDSTTPDMMRVNTGRNDDMGSVELFTTVAHESFPGHMYQTNYARENMDSLYRKAGNSFLGYSEGYATYAEYAALDYLTGVDETVRRLQRDNSILVGGVIARTDIGIHYDGWTVGDMKRFWGESGLVDDDDIISAQYAQIQENPAMFLPYYAGGAAFMELRKTAEEALGGDFDETAFHEALLKSGDAPFMVVERNVKDYIERAREVSAAA